jgi:hypothetical protein
MLRLPLIALALVLGTFAIYAQVTRHELLYWDDDLYIFGSDDLAGDLGRDAVLRAFTEPYQMAWIPVTKLSLLANHALHGDRPAGYLLANVGLHALAAVLLLLALLRLTGELGPSAFVAAVFAFHPLHVESVAWASERKDVLAGVFWMATLLAYAGYAHQPRSAGRYALVLLCFVIGLLSKPMLVTLPCVLLLLDFWPLGRLRRGAVARPLLEKVPLLALSAAASAVALAIQRASGAVVGEKLALGARLVNAVHACLAYLGDAFWPAGLAAFYPHAAATFPVAAAWWGAVALAVLTAGALALARRRGYLATGWLWFLGTLTPVIGIVQVGMQGRADRYMYVPLVGLSIAFAWGVRDLWRRLGLDPRALAALSVAALLALAGAAWAQVDHWRDTEALFQHAVAVTDDNFVAHRKLGDEYARRGMWERAELHYRESLQIRGDSALAHAGLGHALLHLGRASDAVVNLEIAARLDPDSIPRELALAEALSAADRRGEAHAVAVEALALARARGDASMARALMAVLAPLAEPGAAAPGDAAP